MLRESDNSWNSPIAWNRLWWVVLLWLGWLPMLAGHSVTLAWAPCPSPNTVGYHVYYGGSSGSYTNIVNVGNVTNTTISGLTGGATYFFAATSLGADGEESHFSNEASTAIPRPTLDPIENINLIQGTAFQNVMLTGISSDSPTGNRTLQISAASSNPSLVPTPILRYISPATTAILTLKPASTGVGTATITVTVNDGGKSNNIISQRFTVTVASNLPPTLNPIANVTVGRNSGVHTMALTGISSGSPTENQTLKISATSSNPRLIPPPTIRYTSPATNALLTFTPSLNSTGSAIVTVTVNDGGNHNNVVRQSFAVTVVPVVANARPAFGVSQNRAAALATIPTTEGQFSFQVTGLAGDQYVVETTSDLTHWIPVQTNIAPFTFVDRAAAGSSQRFYRASYLPAP